MFRIVGDVAERVSNRRLVAFFPKVGGEIDVLSESFGRFEGDGLLDSNGG